MFSWIRCIGTWPGPSIIVCTSCFQAILRQLAQRLELGELRLVVGVGDRAGAQAVAEGEAHVVRLHDLADLLEVRVEEVLLVVRQAPLGQDASRRARRCRSRACAVSGT